MTISNVVRMYLKSKPYTLEALDSGIVNYSALSRLMQKQLGIKNYQAIKAAIRRYAEDREVLREGKRTIIRRDRVSLSSPYPACVLSSWRSMPCAGHRALQFAFCVL